jgi:hypothetical protein
MSPEGQKSPSEGKWTNNTPEFEGSLGTLTGTVERAQLSIWRMPCRNLDLLP